MKNNFSIKFKRFDMIIIVFLTICISCLLFLNVFFNKPVNSFCRVEIYFQGNLLEDKIIDFKKMNSYEKKDGNIQVILKKKDYSGLLGDMCILAHPEKGVCVQQVICPNHSCKKQGWVKQVNYPLICIPNQVYILLCSDKGQQEIIIG